MQNNTAEVAKHRLSVWASLLVLTCIGAPAGAVSEADTVALVNGVAVERDALLEAASEQLDAVELERVQCQVKADQTKHDVLSYTLEQLVRERLAQAAADKKGEPATSYLERERAARSAAVSDQEVDAFIAARPRLARAPREQVAPQVRAFLVDNALFTDLENEIDVEWSLEPFRLSITGQGVTKGGANAKVELVEFSDFQCPYCRQVNQVLEQVLEKYGDKVKLTFRQFPLESIHPEAFRASEASLCAADQGKFWEMHDLLFAEQGALKETDLKAKADRLGLDRSSFDACMDERRYAQQVRDDLRSGALVGVSSTPSLFINGRPYQQQRTLELLSEVIDEEMARSR